MKTRSFSKFATALLFVTAAAIPARADISFGNMFRNNDYVQTGNGAAAYDSSFLTLNLFSTGANEFTSVQATYPGPGSPVALTQSDPTTYGYSTSFLPSQAAMDAAFPTGSYQFNTTGSDGPLSTAFNFTGDTFAQTVPYLTGNNYSALQGMDPAESFTFQFDTFTPAPATTEADLFLTIFDTLSGAVVYDFGFQPSSTTSLTLPANTLSAGQDYTYQLIYSDRVTTDSPGADFPAQIGSDERTVGSFTTSVPEPSTWALLLLGAMGLLGLSLRRRAARV